MRRHRIEYDGAVYHVIQRSSNKEEIFGRSSDKSYLLKLLAENKEPLAFTLYGYVIMSNHYHMMLQTGPVPLSKIMHRINFLYGGYYNYTHERHGHVFGGRYKAGLILDESYFFSVLRYIHQNPVRAGLCAKVPDYPWSSDGAYRKNNPRLVDVGIILDFFSPDRKEGIKAYNRLMGIRDDIDYTSMEVIGECKSLKKPEGSREQMTSDSKTVDHDEIDESSSTSTTANSIVVRGRSTRKSGDRNSQVGDNDSAAIKTAALKADTGQATVLGESKEVVGEAVRISAGRTAGAPDRDGRAGLASKAGLNRGAVLNCEAALSGEVTTNGNIQFARVRGLAEVGGLTGASRLTGPSGLTGPTPETESTTAPGKVLAVRRRRSLGEILSSCCADKNILELILAGSRKRNITCYKKSFAQEAAREGYTYKDIGAYINISDAAISKLLSS